MLFCIVFDVACKLFVLVLSYLRSLYFIFCVQQCLFKQLAPISTFASEIISA